MQYEREGCKPNIVQSEVDVEKISREKYMRTAEDHLNSTCYIQVIRKILELSIGDDSFDYKTFHQYSLSQNLEHAFDDLNNLNVHVVDQILNIYDHQLKLFSPRHLKWDDILKELLSLYENSKYIALIWNQGHYQVLAKWERFFYIYDPLYDFPIRCTYRELIEYICEDKVRLFTIHDFVDEDYLLDIYLTETICGGAKRKNRKQKRRKKFQ